MRELFNFLHINFIPPTGLPEIPASLGEALDSLKSEDCFTLWNPDSSS